MDTIYSPEEDSYLLSEVLTEKIPILIKDKQDITFLEIGPGSGIQLQTAFKLGIKKENIFSADLNPQAVKHCKKLGFKCIKSNLFEKVNGKYDVIAFNPPYLPLDEREPAESRVSTTGGKKGNEIINEFLKQSKRHLNKNGRIFLLKSSLTGKIDYGKFKKKLIKKRKLFFEELSVLELKDN